MVGECVYITKYIASLRVRHNFVFNIYPLVPTSKLPSPC